MRRIKTWLLAYYLLSSFGLINNHSVQAKEPVEKYPKWGMELRLAPYRPVISGNADVVRLYRLTFDDHDSSVIPRHPLMVGLEVDWYPSYEYGLLGLYGRLSYWTVQGPARRCLSGATTVACNAETVFTSSVVGTDTASLSIAPIGGGIVYRYDEIRRSYGWPLLWYAKLGLDYYFWWASLGDTGSNYHGQPGKGGTLGASASVGISVGLDGWSAKPIYGEQFIKQSNFIFVEYVGIRAKGLIGKQPRLDMTDNTMVAFGLAVDFE